MASTLVHKNLSKNYINKLPKSNLKFSHVQPRVVTDRGEKQTAYGFPTVHIATKFQKKQTLERAGCPGEQLTGRDGSDLKHNDFIENEMYVTQKNPLQMTILNYIEQDKLQTTDILHKTNEHGHEPAKKKKNEFTVGAFQFEDNNVIAKRRAMVQDEKFVDYMTKNRRRYKDMY